MPETFLVFPTMTDEEIIQGIDSNTRFVVLDDHTNTTPTGDPLMKQYLEGRIHIIDQLIRQFPNCIFFSDNYRFSVSDCDNFVWVPLDWLVMPARLKNSTTFPTDWTSKRKFTSNHTGGKNRINRILLEHWLAKNYPCDQLIHTKLEDSTLEMIEAVLLCSKHTSRKHIRPRINLPVQWHPWVKDDQGRSNEEHSHLSTSLRFFVPKIKNQSYLAFVTEPQDITLNTVAGAKTWDCMMGGNLILQFGNYKIIEIMTKLGLETFNNCFDNSHLDSKDRYYQTIGGCENNKKVICDHECVESMWYENIRKIKHNFNLAKDTGHWFRMFEKPLRMLSNALELSKNTEPGFNTAIPVDRFRYEFKL